jgi:hypothetical protein
MPEDRYRDQPPFRASAVLHDGTRLIIRRNGGLEPVRTQTTHTLDGSGASTTYGSACSAERCTPALQKLGASGGARPRARTNSSCATTTPRISFGI